MADKQVIPENKKTIFDWCREGNTGKIKLLLKTTDPNIKDENVSGNLMHNLSSSHVHSIANDIATLGL